MIRSFGDDDTERVASGYTVRRLPADIQRTAFRKLRYLRRATSLDDLRSPPGNRLEALSGDRWGSYSIRVNDEWRICFRWEKGDAHDVAIVDYHR